MNQIEHHHLEAWATQLGGTAVLGFICTLLITGKFLHHVFQFRGLVFGCAIVPPAMLSGLLGLLWFSIMSFIDPVFTNDLGDGLEGVRVNLINFVFAALILGLTSTSSSSQHLASLRGIITSLLHEGMPMVIYSQILIWGHSTICLVALLALNACGAGIPPLFAALVPLGIEAGSDIIVAPDLEGNVNLDSRIVVEESESLGLVAACIMGILLISCKPQLMARGWLGGKPGTLNLTSFIQQDTGTAEHFDVRSTSKIASSSSMHRSFSQGNLSSAGHKSSADMLDERTDKASFASLGAHLSLIALTVFMSFGVSLASRLLEIELRLPVMLSGIRLFKVSMFCALIAMQFIIRRSRIKFKRDWFMRLCGLMLDLLVIAALSRANPNPRALQNTHYLIVSLFSFLCLLWNFICFVVVARHLFPNFWFERGLTLSGEALGHCYMGLLFARTMDPAMESPVPAAYAAKLLCFFIPSSGSKNSIVVNLVKNHGPYAALFISLCVVSTWFIIFEQYFKNRYLKDNVEGKSPGTFESSRAMSRQDFGEEFFDAAPDGALASMLSYDHHDRSLDDIEGHGLDLEDESTAADKGSRARSERPGAETGQGSPDGSGNSGGSSATSRRISVGASSEAAREREQLAFLVQQNHDSSLLSSESPNLPHASPLPRVRTNENSSIVTPDQMSSIAAMLGDRQSSRAWALKYSLRRDGASMDTLLGLSCMRDRSGKPTFSSSVIVIEDSWGYIFGVFVAHALENKGDYYGNGESFVFTVAPETQKYKWTGANTNFIISNSKTLVVGAGGEGFALQLDDELDTGVSSRSATYENQQLSSGEFFRCLNCEVWNLDTLAEL